MNELKLYHASLIIDTGVDHFEDIQIVFAEDTADAISILRTFVDKNYDGYIEHCSFRVLPMEKGVLSAPNKFYKVRERR